MDIFCEYMVKRKKSVNDYLKMAGIVFAAIIVNTLAFVFLFRYLMGFELLLMAGIWFGAYVLITRTSIEYEYILTNGILDIDKIMSKKTRKRVITIDFKAIDTCAPANGVKGSNNPSAKVLDLSGDINAKNVYYVDFSKNATIYRVFFTPNAKILNNLKMINPRQVTVNEDDIK